VFCDGWLNGRVTLVVSVLLDDLQQVLAGDSVVEEYKRYHNKKDCCTQLDN